MITPTQTNHLFLSALLESQYPKFFQELKQILNKNAISFSLLDATADIWCRDYMPAQLSADEFLWFRFQPDYYGKKLEHKITKQLDLHEQIKGQHYFSDLVLDGGNLVYNHSVAIVTEKVLKDNPGKTRQEIIDQLQYELRLGKVVLIPKQPYDWTGHADGMVRFMDEHTLLVNDFSKESPSWRAKLERSLQGHDFETLDFPYVSLDEKNQSGEYTARGCYINFLQLGKLIVLPQFNLTEDTLALEMIKKLYPAYSIETIICNDIAKEGGVLNCLSWGMKTALLF